MVDRPGGVADIVLDPLLYKACMHALRTHAGKVSNGVRTH
jgi:hypothetical protein